MVKSTINFLNDFFVQNGYFRDKDDGKNTYILVKFYKWRKKGKRK